MAVINPLTRLQLLRPVSIFRGLDKATLFEVARKAVEVSYPAGTTVVRQGDPGDTLCIVTAGTVEVLRNEAPVRRLGPGDYFGEISLIDGEPRSASVVAIDDVVLLELASADFVSLLGGSYVAHIVMKNLAGLLRQAEEAAG